MLLLSGMHRQNDTRLALAERALALQNELLQPKAAEEIALSTSVLDWFRGVEPLRPRDHPNMHRLFGASTGYSDHGPPDPSVVRLLTVESDPDWRFTSYASDLEFFISADDLARKNFEGAYANFA